VKLGLVQMRCTADPKANLANALGFIQKAAERGAQIVCLQELFASQYFCQSEDHKYFALAEEIPGPTTTALATLAKDRAIVIVASLFEKRSAGKRANGDTWFSFEKTKGPSDLYVQSNTWLPAGSTGWHKHPGHSLIIITSGQVTQYHADCTPQVYGPGTANGPTLVDSGDDEHLIRNETSSSATSFAVQIVANGAPRRIDIAEAPATCQIF